MKIENFRMLIEQFETQKYNIKFGANFKIRRVPNKLFHPNYWRDTPSNLILTMLMWLDPESAGTQRAGTLYNTYFPKLPLRLRNDETLFDCIPASSPDPSL